MPANLNVVMNWNGLENTLIPGADSQPPLLAGGAAEKPEQPVERKIHCEKAY